MGRADRGGWCILRTSGPRTLKLAAALRAAGYEAWTPTVPARRIVRGTKPVTFEERPTALIPTFVFACSGHVSDLLAIIADPLSRLPTFSMLRERDRIPVVTEHSLAALRAAEEREQKRAAKKRHHSIAAGSRVQPHEGAFAGMTGIVESSTGKAAQVNFGGGFVVSIATYLLDSSVLRPAA